jgi:hypothetical protein
MADGYGRWLMAMVDGLRVMEAIGHRHQPLAIAISHQPSAIDSAAS